ncbi:MAG TPA: sugar phosphate isomerase/epimerase family protein [Flavisolibacter sp.]|nr:sugar phosphate isomerase/epimerase family protein [Flavisolibacter sp.]
MSSLTRKEFLQTSVFALANLLINSSFRFNKKNLLLSFSTLGCPDWNFQQIVNFATQHGYKGLELRGIQRQLDLTQCPPFSTEESRKDTLALMKENGLRFVGLGSSANLHFAEGAEREKNLAEARNFITLAEQIGCPYVRVFPNKLPKDTDKKTTIHRIVKGLQELGDYAKEKKVMVLMETHGDVVYSDDIFEIMQAAANKNIGLVWDVTNMWTVTKEPPAQVYQKLKNYIHHTHIKDAKLVDGKPQYTLLGQGNVPIFEAIDALSTGGYSGYYSFEWEKLWHPEIAEPGIALADYPIVMEKHFGKSRSAL